MGLGYVKGVTHDYLRHGSTTLFAAFDAQRGRVIAQWKPHYRHQEFLRLLEHLDTHVPARLDVHLIRDHCATHKRAKVRAWLAERPRYQVHVTPTYNFWLNQLERWLG